MTDAALTVKEVAEHLGVQQRSVLELIKSGALLASDVSLNPTSGRPRWRIQEAELQNFLDRRVHQPTTKRRRRRKPAIHPFG